MVFFFFPFSSGWLRWSAPTALCPQTAAQPQEACESLLVIFSIFLHGYVFSIQLCWTDFNFQCLGLEICLIIYCNTHFNVHEADNSQVNMFQISILDIWFHYNPQWKLFTLLCLALFKINKYQVAFGIFAPRSGDTKKLERFLGE